jgi:hypothetical protein
VISRGSVWKRIGRSVEGDVFMPELIDKAEAEGELMGLSFIADPLK